MAALDFPASPTNGQVYANWIYSTAKGAWQAKPITGKVTTSAVAPSAPTNGDEWFNTNDGNLYVYYTDVDGSQWVQVKSDATLSSTLGNRVTTLELKPSGLVPVVPASITQSSGTSSVDTSGLITFNSVSNIALNNIFSSSYTNYKFIMRATFDIQRQAMFRMRSAGTDNTSAVYTTNGYYQAGSGALSTYQAVGSTTGYFGEGVGDTSLSYDIITPFTTNRTNIVGITKGYIGAAATMQLGIVHDAAASFDGIDIFPPAGNMTGTMKVYGYN